MIPAEWGLDAYTTSELKTCLASVDGQLAGDLSDRDRKRLAERRTAVLAEQADRARIAAQPLGDPRALRR